MKIKLDLNNQFGQTKEDRITGLSPGSSNQLINSNRLPKTFHNQFDTHILQEET